LIAEFPNDELRGMVGMLGILERGDSHPLYLVDV